jgi:hypothetical protein
MSERFVGQVAPTIATLVGAVVGLQLTVRLGYLAMKPPTIAPYATCAINITTGVAMP